MLLLKKTYRIAGNAFVMKSSGPVDLVSIGCPHLSLEELRDLAWMLEGEKVAKDTDLWIWTDYATQMMAGRSGYIAMIERSNAKVLNSSCPLVMREKSHERYSSMVMNGAKQAHSIRGQTDAKVYVGDVKACINAALREDGRFKNMKQRKSC